ncbi:hypothetical protein [Nocardia sp. NPDC047654]
MATPTHDLDSPAPLTLDGNALDPIPLHDLQVPAGTLRQRCRG